MKPRLLNSFDTDEIYYNLTNTPRGIILHGQDHLLLLSDRSEPKRISDISAIQCLSTSDRLVILCQSGLVVYVKHSETRSSTIWTTKDSPVEALVQTKTGEIIFFRRSSLEFHSQQLTLSKKIEFKPLKSRERVENGVVTLEITKRNRSLFEALLCRDLRIGQELLLFATSHTLGVVCLGDKDPEASVLRQFSSKISAFFPLPEVLAIILTTGFAECLYFNLTDQMVQQESIFIHHSITSPCWTKIHHDEAIIFSIGPEIRFLAFEVVQNVIENGLKMSTKSVRIPCVSGMAWNESGKGIIATENGFIYALETEDFAWEDEIRPQIELMTTSNHFFHKCQKSLDRLEEKLTNLELLEGRTNQETLQAKNLQSAIKCLDERSLKAQVSFEQDRIRSEIVLVVVKFVLPASFTANLWKLVAIFETPEGKVIQSSEELEQGEVEVIQEIQINESVLVLPSVNLELQTVISELVFSVPVAVSVHLPKVENFRSSKRFKVDQEAKSRLFECKMVANARVLSEFNFKEDEIDEPMADLSVLGRHFKAKFNRFSDEFTLSSTDPGVLFLAKMFFHKEMGFGFKDVKYSKKLDLSLRSLNDDQDDIDHLLKLYQEFRK